MYVVDGIALDVEACEDTRRGRLQNANGRSAIAGKGGAADIVETVVCNGDIAPGRCGYGVLNGMYGATGKCCTNIMYPVVFDRQVAGPVVPTTDRVVVGGRRDLKPVDGDTIYCYRERKAASRSDDGLCHATAASDVRIGAVEGQGLVEDDIFGVSAGSHGEGVAVEGQRIINRILNGAVNFPGIGISNLRGGC